MLRRLQGRSIRACVVLRGYGSRGGLSDEAELYKMAVGKDAVFVGQDRVKSLTLAKQQGFEVAIMDDAFQHRRAHRDFDLVLIDATRPPMGEHLLPAGLMREGLTALGRASEVWLTRTEQCAPEQLFEIENCLAQRGLRTERVETSVRGLRPLFKNESLSQAETYYCVSAIGHPQNFKATALSMGLDIIGESWFPDHHHFSRLEQVELIERARRKASGIVMTSKDAVKWSEEGPIFVLEIASVLPQPHFDEVLEQLFL
jgi:tetraacyldisaccharide 4'-kinase